MSVAAGAGLGGGEDGWGGAGRGAGLAVGLYAAINDGVMARILAAPVERLGFFLGRSALFALLWGPVLGFVWLVKAQEMNRRLGMRMVDEGGKG